MYIILVNKDIFLGISSLVNSFLSLFSLLSFSSAACFLDSVCKANTPTRMSFREVIALDMSGFGAVLVGALKVSNTAGDSFVKREIMVPSGFLNATSPLEKSVNPDTLAGILISAKGNNENISGKIYNCEPEESPK